VYVGIESGTLKSWAETLGLDSAFEYVAAAIQIAGIALICIGAAMTNIFMVVAGAVLLAAGITIEVLGEQTLMAWWETLKLTTVAQWISVAILLAGIAMVAIAAATANIPLLIAGAIGEETAMALSTIQGTYITKQYILGGYQAEYQFKLIYRIKPGNSNDRRLEADELLNHFGDWARKNLPDLGDGVRALKVEPTTQSSKFASYEGGGHGFACSRVGYRE
jgi:hypothetical protein